jgi:hypothetical protein
MHASASARKGGRFKKTAMPISGFLTSFGKNFREALNSKEPTKIVKQLSVNSGCNSIYKKDGITGNLGFGYGTKKNRNINSE